MQYADPVAPLSSRMRRRWEYAGLDHPFEHVWGLERTRVGHVVLAIVLALLLHGALAAKGVFGLYDIGDFARAAQQLVQEQTRRVVTVSMIRPEPEPEPEPDTKKAEPDAPPPERVPAPRQRVRAAAPAAARAGRVLTAQPDPNEPLDLTGNTFVQGSAESYAGGVTARSGTSNTAVRDLGARAGGVVGGRGKEVGDQSRAARPLDEEWNCPFPAEADVEQINFKRVQVVVKVGTTGKALDVTVVSDPGYGFGLAAKRCAMRQRYQPALGNDGKPIVGTARSFYVRFSR
jgi:periplasmic protein TonB